MLADLTQINESLVHTIETNPWLAPLAALFGGLLTAANPCVIAMVPLMMAYVAGQDGERSLKRSFALSLTFSLGLTITFAALFLAAAVLAPFLSQDVWKYIAAGVCMLMGLHLLGVLTVTIPAPAGFTPSRRGFAGALLLGLLFGLVSLPCAGPILAVLLSFVGVKGAVFTGTLLVAYSLGHCALILVAGTSMGLAQHLIESKGLQNVNAWLKRIAGMLIILIGLYLLFC